MNGEFKRGEIYWVRDALTNGSEEAFKRPFVIVSNDKHNSKLSTIIGACLTTKVQRGPVDVFIKTTNRPSWVMCDHIVEIDKSRVMEYYCTCSQQEMGQIDDALRFSLGLGEEVSETADSVEADMYKRMYEKVLDELVKLKLELDLREKLAAVEEPPKVDVPKVVERVRRRKVAEKEKVNINTATAEEIAKALGIGLALAYMITEYRRDNGNFVDIEELRDVPELSEEFVEKYGDKIVIDSKNDQIKKNDDEIKTKVNINTATPEEIRVKTGLGRVACEEIRAYRNKNGPFQGVEELLNLRHFGAICMKRYGAMLEV